MWISADSERYPTYLLQMHITPNSSKILWRRFEIDSNVEFACKAPGCASLTQATLADDSSFSVRSTLNFISLIQSPATRKAQTSYPQPAPTAANTDTNHAQCGGLVMKNAGAPQTLFLLSLIYTFQPSCRRKAIAIIHTA